MKKLKKFVVLCLAVTMLLTACGKKGEEVTKELSITQMQTICELATLKCYYHNVAKLTKEKRKFCGGIHRQSFGSSIPVS